jgi:hypothetical protein
MEGNIHLGDANATLETKTPIHQKYFLILNTMHLFPSDADLKQISSVRGKVQEVARYSLVRAPILQTRICVFSSS